MRVGLNLVFLTPGESGGMETYARELIPALAAREDIETVAFVNRPAAAAGGPWATHAEQVVLDVDVTRRIEWVRAEQQMLPGLARSAGIDVLHSLASTAPAWGPTPRVTTIHDLLYRKVPDAHFGLRALGMRVLVPAAAHRSDRVIVDAASTRADLVADLGVAEAKIDVVPLAAGSGDVAGATPPEEIRARLDLGNRPVVLSVSAKRAHKNLARLIEAVAAIPDERRPVVVIPGYPTPHEEELWEQAGALGVSSVLRMPAWVSAADLEALYAVADVCVLPSLYEGFGLPVLEAMRRGVPVACSNRSSLPEVAGDAALLFDPEDRAAIGAAIERVLADKDLADRLARDGSKRAAAFTWEATAELTAASYERTLETAR